VNLEVVCTILKFPNKLLYNIGFITRHSNGCNSPTRALPSIHWEGELDGHQASRIYFMSPTPKMDPSQYTIFLIKYENKEILGFLKVTFAVHHQRATNAKKSQNEIIRF
jgi:hypothetical protein